MEGVACQGPRHKIIVEIHLGNVDDVRMRGKDSNVRHTLNDLGFVGILPSADFGDRFVRYPEGKMLSFFLPPSLCDLDVGLEAGSFIEQITGNRTIQVDSSCHGNSRFPVLASNNGITRLFSWINTYRRRIFLRNLSARGLYGSFS